MNSRNSTPPSREKLLLQMSGLCAKCEQCEHDLREKMRRKGATSADIDQVIDYLYDHNFLDEERYARAYARDKLRFNGWGRLKIRMMLASKRLSREAIAVAMEATDIPEYSEVLEQMVRGKARALDLSDAADRQKLLRSIYSRGFEPQLIIKAMEALRRQ